MPCVIEADTFGARTDCADAAQKATASAKVSRVRMPTVYISILRVNDLMMFLVSAVRSCAAGLPWSGLSGNLDALTVLLRQSLTAT